LDLAVAQTFPSELENGFIVASLRWAKHPDKKQRRAIRIRCHVHKWRNIEAALGDEPHKATGLFWAIRDAKDMNEAQKISDQLESVLKALNISALNSYLEAKEDLLAIHSLKLSKNLKRFFSTTNPIESLNSLIEGNHSAQSVAPFGRDILKHFPSN
jgi:transposase-like protein